MRLPRVKPVFLPVPVGNGKIRIGGIDLGIAAELDDDENGCTRRLLELLDGLRTSDDIVRLMHEFDPTVTSADVMDAIDELAAAGYLEDAADDPPPGVFTARELERYRRNLEFLSHFHQPSLNVYDYQARLHASRVTVLGIGGFGTFVSLMLAAFGVGELHLVDFDTVELINLNRQVLYCEADVGRYKVDAAADQLSRVNPNVRITTGRTKVDGLEAARDCCRDADLVVCAADRPPGKIYEWLNQAALERRVPWVRGGSAGLTASAFMHVPYETACYDCVQLALYEDVPWAAPHARYMAEHLEDRSVNPCVAPVAGILGSLIAMELTKQLTGIETPAIAGRRVVCDIRRMEFSYVDGVRRPDCPSCAVAVESAAALAGQS
ncbi:MAG: HesA/MoeB/ThiF family protein [Streptosporangiaceae bacterium]|nr:HesA/MoeB/ThiF family protein [Streptosporangiaceae bacterium]